MIQSVTAVGLCTVQARIDEIAEQARIEDSSCIGVDETLAALPWVYRRRLVLTPESLKAFSPDPGVRAAAQMFLGLAAKIWAAMPLDRGLDRPDEAMTSVEVWKEKVPARRRARE